MATGIVRKIGDFQFEVTVKEQHRDDMTITSHPVERKAPITDHAFRMPAQLTVEVASSAAGFTGILTLSDLYASLLATQATATIVSVQTGKRLYDNMLIKSIAVETDYKTENILSLTIQLQEIFLVDTITVAMPSNSVMSNPEGTATTTNSGAKALQ